MIVFVRKRENIRKTGALFVLRNIGTIRLKKRNKARRVDKMRKKGSLQLRMKMVKKNVVTRLMR